MPVTLFQDCDLDQVTVPSVYRSVLNWKGPPQRFHSGVVGCE